MTDVELRDELMTMLAAGHETTATGLAFAFDLLLRNPEVLAAPARRARRRRRRLPRRGRHRDAAAAPGDRRRRAHADEAARRSPGWELPAGIRVYPAIALVHRREDLYPEAERVPARALPRRRRRVLRLAAVRRRHPPLHRRRARAGRDGRGDPRGRPTASSSSPLRPEPDPVVLRGITLVAAPRHAGAGQPTGGDAAGGGAGTAATACAPPSACRISPLTARERSESRNSAASATAVGVAAVPAQRRRVAPVLGQLARSRGSRRRPASRRARRRPG